MSRHGRERTPGPGRAQIAAALAACLAAGALYAVQARPGFAPTDHALDLTRPAGFVLPGSGAVGPSEFGLLRWEGDAPLRLHLPGLGPPARLRLKLFPECTGAVLELRADERAFAELAPAQRWTLYETAPVAAGDVLTLAWAAPGPPCPVHVSAVRNTTVRRQSSDFPRYWVVRTGPGGHPPPPGGPGPWVVAGLLAASAAWAAAGGTSGAGRLAGWLRLVAPGVVVLAAAEGLARAAGLRLVYPPASFPGLLLAPGLLGLAWYHRRRLREAVRTPISTALRWMRPRPALVLAVLALGTWGWILTGVARTQFGGDLRGLVRFGERFGTASRFPGVPVISPDGYDGQFYAVLATDPFLTEEATVERLDDPAHRATRILVPLLAWAISLGRPEVALWAYMGICWSLSLASVVLVGSWLRGERLSPWWALSLVPCAGLAVSLSRVTIDGPALGLLLLAFTFHRAGRTGWAAATGAAAALTKEVYVLGALALAAVEARHGRWRRSVLLATPALALLGLWWLYTHGGDRASSTAFAHVVGLPFTWVPGKIAQLGALSTPLPEDFRLEALGVVAISLGFVSAVSVAPRIQRNPAALLFFALGVVGFFSSEDVYEDLFGYGRIFIALPFLALLVAADTQVPGRTRWLLLATVLSFCLAGVYLILLY